MGNPTERWENGAAVALTAEEVTALTPTLDRLRTLKAAAIQVQFVTRLGSGFVYKSGLNPIAIDDGSRANLGAMALKATLVSLGQSTWPDNYAKGWITLAGDRIPLATGPDGLALADAAGDYYAALAQHGQDLEDAADAAADAAGLAEIDETAGWPSNAGAAA